MIRIMLKKKFSFLTLFGILPLFLFSCSQVQKAFDPERKNSNQEFLVEKKTYQENHFFMHQTLKEATNVNQRNSVYL